MAKVKTYWDSIKDQETFYSGGSRGWEVHLRRLPYYRHNPKTHQYKEVETLQFVWPFYSGDGVSREEKSETRKEVTMKRKLERILASASIDRSEYYDLCSRINTPELKQEIIKLHDDGLKGFSLRNYIQHNHLTDAQAHTLFWRM